MREILAVRKVLQSFAPKLAGLCVKWHTDKQNVARCWCWFQDVWFAKRSLAYFWGLLVLILFFCFLQLKWGLHSIDRFADEHNHLLPRFDSRFWNSYCEAINTFTRSCDFVNNWFVRTLFLGPWGTCGTLIVPLWRSAPFWPLLTTDGSHLVHFVEDWVDLLPLKTTFCMGRHSYGVFGRENLNFRVLAVRINFRSARFFVSGFCFNVQGWCSQSPVFICLVE